MDKSFNQIAADTKEAVQTQNALKSLASHQGQELATLISGLDPGPGAPGSNDVSDAKDITGDFLTPADTASNPIPESCIIVYKGILRRLSGMKPPAGTVAILAGSCMSQLLGWLLQKLWNQR